MQAGEGFSSSWLLFYQQARGEFLQAMGDDDFLLRHSVDSTVRAMVSSRAQLCCTEAYMGGRGGHARWHLRDDGRPAFRPWDGAWGASGQRPTLYLQESRVFGKAWAAQRDAFEASAQCRDCECSLAHPARCTLGPSCTVAPSAETCTACCEWCRLTSDVGVAPRGDRMCRTAEAHGRIGSDASYAEFLASGGAALHGEFRMAATERQRGGPWRRVVSDGVEQHVTPAMLDTVNVMVASSCMVTRSIVARAGSGNALLPNGHEDWEYWKRILTFVPHALVLSDPGLVYDYYEHGKPSQLVASAGCRACGCRQAASGIYGAMACDKEDESGGVLGCCAWCLDVPQGGRNGQGTCVAHYPFISFNADI